MEEVMNLTQDDVLDLIRDFPVQPLRNKVIISLNTAEDELSGNSMDEIQFVVAKGSHVLDLEPGQRVLLDLERMMHFEPQDENVYERKGVIKIKPIQVEGRVFALIPDSYIDAKDFR